MVNLSSAIEAVLFAAGDCVPIARLSLILGVEEEEVGRTAEELAEAYIRDQRGIRILRLEDKLQMCSATEYAQIIIKALEHRRPPVLSQPALETLSIVAYYQPVTRAYIDQIRGVDSSYTVSVLQEKGLIETSGRLDVPGRPALFKTTDAFLRTMNIQSLSELPPLPDMTENEGIEKLQHTIEELRNSTAGQITLSEVFRQNGEV